MNIKRNISNNPLKAGIWYTISNFLIKGLAFLTLPIFTRLMTTKDIGIFSNITSWFNILAIITTFEIYSSVTIARFDYKDDLDDYISSSLVLGTMITLFFYIIVLIFNQFFQKLFVVDFITLNIMFIYLLVYPAVQMFQIKHVIKYNYIKSTIVSLVSAVAATFISLILVVVMNDKLHARIYGYFIPLILISIIVYFVVLHKGEKISSKYWKYALKISFPLIWHLLAGYALSSADKIMITRIISPEANALYSVSYTISMIASILWISMNNAWSPWAYEQMDEKKYIKLRKSSKPYTMFFLLIVGGLLLISPELLLLMGGNYYLQAKYVMPPVMIGYVFQFVYSLYVNIEFYHKKQRNIAIGTILAALVNIILNLIFIPIFGYIAAAYTTLIGYILLFFIHFIFVKKMGCSDWYDTRFFCKILLISLIFIPLINILYNYNIIRYGIIIIAFICVLIIIIKNYRNITKLIKKKKYKKIINLFIRKRGV